MGRAASPPGAQQSGGVCAPLDSRPAGSGGTCLPLEVGPGGAERREARRQQFSELFAPSGQRGREPCLTRVLLRSGSPWGRRPGHCCRPLLMKWKEKGINQPSSPRGHAARSPHGGGPRRGGAGSPAMTCHKARDLVGSLLSGKGLEGRQGWKGGRAGGDPGRGRSWSQACCGTVWHCVALCPASTGSELWQTLPAPCPHLRGTYCSMPTAHIPCRHLQLCPGLLLPLFQVGQAGGAAASLPLPVGSPHQ